MENIEVEQAMSRNPIALNKSMTVAEAVKFARGKGFSVFPIVDLNNRYVGMISEARLRRLLAEGNQDKTIAQFMESRPYILPEATLLEAVVKMHHLETRQIAVINSKKDRKLTGLLTMTDIVLKQAEENLEDDIDITVMPEMSAESELLETQEKK